MHFLSDADSVGSDEMMLFACDITAIPADQRASHAAATSRLL